MTFRLENVIQAAAIHCSCLNQLSHQRQDTADRSIIGITRRKYTPIYTVILARLNYYIVLITFKPLIGSHPVFILSQKCCRTVR